MADADERVVLDDRMVVGDAVDGGRGDQHGAAHARLARSGEGRGGAVDVDRANRLARALDRQRRGRVHEHVRASDEPGRVAPVADVAAQLLDRALELGLVERGRVERAHGVAVGQQPAGEVQAEKARAA